MLQKIISTIKEGVSGILFPHICTICDTSLSQTEQAICTTCLISRFEMANPDYKSVSSDVLLPDGIHIQTALWGFDKGGELQELLHKLKYGGRPDIGEGIGKAMGWELNKHPNFDITNDACLLPVPLHKKKLKKRGYNQAYHIAKGLSEVIEVEVCPEACIERIKNTSTQTGYNLSERTQNMTNAFKVYDDSCIYDKTVVIVDDVFTTGATTFELANLLLSSGAKKIMIATAAQA